MFSALVTFFLIRPLSHDGMVDEDEKFRAYLEENGYDVSQLGLVADAAPFEPTASVEKDPSLVKEVEA